MTLNNTELALIIIKQCRIVINDPLDKWQRSLHYLLHFPLTHLLALLNLDLRLVRPGLRGLRSRRAGDAPLLLQAQLGVELHEAPGAYVGGIDREEGTDRLGPLVTK